MIDNPTKLIHDIANSQTTTKVLSTLVMGIAAAYLLRSENLFAMVITLLVLALAATAILVSSYAKAKAKTKEQQRKPRTEPTINQRRWIPFNNGLLVFLLLMLISLST